MTKVAVLGAAGRIARHAVAMLASDPRVEQTLFVRDADRLGDAPTSARVAEGDALDEAAVADVVRDRDLVYANLAGDIDHQARVIVDAMTHQNVHRLVFVTALGIYDEVPGAFGEWNRQQIGSMLKPYRAAADTIEGSGLDYTILRPAWLTDKDEIDFEVTNKGQPFNGTEVSRKSVAALVVDIVNDPTTGSRASLGVNKPDTDGDRPAWL